MINTLDFYDTLFSKDAINAASYFEWNTYRVFKHLGGFVTLNPHFKMDELGNPLGCAIPGVEDILIEYPSFKLLIECSLRSGVSQLDNEAESISRHFEERKKKSITPCIMIFLAPSINLDFARYISFDKSAIPIIPLTVNQFKKLILCNIDFNPSEFQEKLNSLLFSNLNFSQAAQWLNSIDDSI